MRDLWWRLPGPNRFVRRVACDLRDGKNVILCLPGYFPDRITTALRLELPDEKWDHLLLDSQDPATPLDLLYSRFAQNAEPQELRNVANLVCHDDFGGRIVWLSGITPAIWPAWKHFLSEYEAACRSVPLLQRTVFCIPLCGELGLDAPREDVCLTSRLSKGVVDYIDILLFSSNVVQPRCGNPLVRRVVISVVADLALWDPEVVLALASATVEDILDPLEILCDLAKKRGWGNESIDAWHNGSSDFFEGRERTHSALLAIKGTRNEIQRRIWSAEVSRILPYVEEQRQDLLERLRGVLRVPFRTRFGEIVEDVHDLEIGHIEAQLKDLSNNDDRDLLKQVERLRDIRNRLSHLETVPLELLVACTSQNR